MPQRMDGLRKEQDRDAEETGVRTPLAQQFQSRAIISALKLFVIWILINKLTASARLYFSFANGGRQLPPSEVLQANNGMRRWLNENQSWRAKVTGSGLLVLEMTAHPLPDFRITNVDLEAPSIQSAQS